MIPSFSFAEDYVLGTTSYGYYIRSGNKILFVKERGDEPAQVFTVSNKPFTYCFTKDYFVVFTLDEKTDGEVFYYEGSQKRKLKLYPGQLKYKIPFVQVIGENRIAVSTCENKGKVLSHTLWIDETAVFDLEKDEYFPILRQSFSENSTGEVMGRVVTAVGGSGNNLYIVRSKISYSEKDLQKSEITKYKINFNSKEIEEIDKIQIPYDIIYITGNTKYALINIYDPNKPLKNAGKLLEIQGGDYKEIKEIPEIYSSNDIIEAMAYEEQIAFKVPKGVYLLRLGNDIELKKSDKKILDYLTFTQILKEDLKK